MSVKCNRCDHGFPEFAGTVFKNGKVYHLYRCVDCGAMEERYINPIGFDLDDPRAVRTMHLTRDYGLRIGIYE